jgi:hypothetical protein
MDDSSCANQIFQDVSDFTSLPVTHAKECAAVEGFRVSLLCQYIHNNLMYWQPCRFW